MITDRGRIQERPQPRAQPQRLQQRWRRRAGGRRNDRCVRCEDVARGREKAQLTKEFDISLTRTFMLASCCHRVLTNPSVSLLLADGGFYTHLHFSVCHFFHFSLSPGSRSPCFHWMPRNRAPLQLCTCKFPRGAVTKPYKQQKQVVHREAGNVACRPSIATGRT